MCHRDHLKIFDTFSQLWASGNCFQKGLCLICMCYGMDLFGFVMHCIVTGLDMVYL
jgi:hypothetical protein